MFTMRTTSFGKREKESEISIRISADDIKERVIFKIVKCSNFLKDKFELKEGGNINGFSFTEVRDKGFEIIIRREVGGERSFLKNSVLKTTRVGIKFVLTK